MRRLCKQVGCVKMHAGTGTAPARPHRCRCWWGLVAWARSIQTSLAHRDVRKSIRYLDERITACEEHVSTIREDLLALRCSVLIATADAHSPSDTHLPALILEERETQRRLHDAHKITAALKRQRGLLVDSDMNTTVVHTLRDVLNYLQSSHAGGLDVVQVDDLLEERDDIHAATEEVTNMLSASGAHLQESEEEEVFFRNRNNHSVQAPQAVNLGRLPEPQPKTDSCRAELSARPLMC